MIDKSFMEYDLNVFMILLESTSMTKELGWPHWKDVMFYFGHFWASFRWWIKQMFRIQAMIWLLRYWVRPGRFAGFVSNTFFFSDLEIHIES